MIIEVKEVEIVLLSRTVPCCEPNISQIVLYQKSIFWTFSSSLSQICGLIFSSRRPKKERRGSLRMLQMEPMENIKKVQTLLGVFHLCQIKRGIMLPPLQLSQDQTLFKTRTEALSHLAEISWSLNILIQSFLRYQSLHLKAIQIFLDCFRDIDDLYKMCSIMVYIFSFTSVQLVTVKFVLSILCPCMLHKLIPMLVEICLHNIEIVTNMIVHQRDLREWNVHKHDN